MSSRDSVISAVRCTIYLFLWENASGDRAESGIRNLFRLEAVSAENARCSNENP